MVDDEALSESQYGKLRALGSEFEEVEMVAVLFFSLKVQDEYAFIVSSINTLLQIMATWLYVRTIFVEDWKRLKLLPDTPNKMTTSDESGHVASVTGRPNSEKRTLRRPRGESLMRCF